MAKKDKKPLHPFRDIAATLHVKHHTAGTSNELSLSVLDGLKSQTEEKKSNTPRTVRLGKLSVFTAPSGKERAAGVLDGGKKAAPTGADVAGYALDMSAASRKRAAAAKSRALVDPEGEIRRRKARRRARRIAGTAAAFAACVALVAAASLYLIGEYERMQGNLGLLHQGMSELERADELVVAMDAAITGTATDASADDIARIQESLADAEVHINAATAFADDAYADMADSNDKQAADQVRQSAAARLDMIAAARILLDEDVQALSAVAEVEAGWDLLMQAAALSQEAAALVEDTTAENTRASQEKSEQARTLLNEASGHFARAAELYPEADLEPFQSYIAKRIEAIGYAIASDEAIYLQDRQTAEANNELYNAADAEAADLARAIADNPAQPVIDAFEDTTAPYREDYLQARSRAGESDAFIRDYLGQSRQ